MNHLSNAHTMHGHTPLAQRNATAVALVAAALVGAFTATAPAQNICVTGTNAIPDGAGSASRVIDVPAPATPSVIASLTVSAVVTHPWVGDLRIVLRHPSGAEVVLLDRPGIPSIGFPGPWGCGGDGIDALFDDSALTGAESTCETSGIAIAGPRRPSEPLASFAGLAPHGAWTLEVVDDVVGDSGSLGAVCLNIVTKRVVACPADLDGSGAVDGADLAVILGGWGSACSGCPEDLTGDDLIDGADLAVLLGAWGEC